MATKPTHIAYVVENFEKDGKPDSSWTRIGVAFAHREGTGFNLVLKPGISVSGRIVCKEPPAGNSAE